MDNWQKLCEAIKTYTIHPEHCPFKKESCFEDHFSEYLRYIFGWDYDEVKRQYVVKFGHDNKRTDITLFHDELPVVVFELKAFGQPLAGEEVSQFASYMKQLETQFGILTNSVALQLYYRPHRRGEPKKILNLRFEGDNPDGQRLGELLTKANFSEQKFSQFCDSLIERKKETPDYDCPFDAENPIMADQMNKDMDDKILEMIGLYCKWVDSNEKERTYMQNYEEGMAWVRENVFIIPDQKNFTDKDYVELVHQIPQHLCNLKNGANRVLYTGLEGSRKTFVAAIRFLNSAPSEQKFGVIRELLDNPAYKIKGMGRSFWSELVRCKFPDVPLVNSKTNDFFIALGLNIGVTAEEQLPNLAYCYNRWRYLYQKLKQGSIDTFKLSHMEHFAKESEDGRDFMLKNFNAVMGDNTR